MSSSSPEQPSCDHPSDNQHPISDQQNQRRKLKAAAGFRRRALDITRSKTAVSVPAWGSGKYNFINLNLYLAAGDRHHLDTDIRGAIVIDILTDQLTHMQRFG